MMIQGCLPAYSANQIAGSVPSQVGKVNVLSIIPTAGLRIFMPTKGAVTPYISGIEGLGTPASVKADLTIVPWHLPGMILHQRDCLP